MNGQRATFRFRTCKILHFLQRVDDFPQLLCPLRELVGWTHYTMVQVRQRFYLPSLRHCRGSLRHRIHVGLRSQIRFIPK